jgi:hypothetical protein
MYLLSARDIVGPLAISATYKPESYMVGRSAFIPQFRIGDVSPALDRIEHSLKIQSYQQVTTVLARLHIPYPDLVDDNIDYEWTAPLPSPQANVPSLFREKKEGLRKIVTSPRKCLKLSTRLSSRAILRGR